MKFHVNAKEEPFFLNFRKKGTIDKETGEREAVELYTILTYKIPLSVYTELISLIQTSDTRQEIIYDILDWLGINQYDDEAKHKKYTIELERAMINSPTVGIILRKIRDKLEEERRY